MNHFALSRVISMTIVLTWAATPAMADKGPFFWDEFDRSSLREGDFGWHEWRVSTEIHDGSLTFVDFIDTFPSIGLSLRQPLGDYSIRAAVRFHDPRSFEINPWIGLYGRGRPGAVFTNYWAGPAADGNVYIGESGNGIDQIVGSKRLFSRDEILNQDIEMEFRFADETMSLFAWTQGSPRPDRPALVMKDTTIADGVELGLALNPNEALTSLDVRYFALLPGSPGDFNASNALDVEDIDLLATEIRLGEQNRAYDLTNDSLVNDSDLDELIHRHFKSWTGDTNLDGEFNSTDLLVVFQAGQYEDQVSDNSSWSTGDWNADGEFTTSDLMVAFQDGGYDRGPRTAVALVPEPTSQTLMAISLWGLLRRRRHRLQIKPGRQLRFA